MLLRARIAAVMLVLLPLPAAGTVSSDFNVYWGDLHGHTMSEPVTLTPQIIANYYLHARDAADLDFVALTEKDFDITDANWSAIQVEVSRYTSSGSFVVLSAFEWGDDAYEAFGHRPVFYASTTQPLLRSNVAATDHVSELLDRVATTTDGLTSAAHPDLGNYKTNWDYFDGNVDRVSEIYSRHGHFEDGDAGIQQALARGFRFGFTAVSDTRSGTPGSHGLTAVLATSLTRANLINAIRQRRLYATTGARIKLWFAADGKEMGREYASASAPTFTVECTPTAPLDRIEILKNNVVVYTWVPAATAASAGGSSAWRTSNAESTTLEWTTATDDAGWQPLQLEELHAPRRVHRLRQSVRAQPGEHLILRTDLPGEHRIWVNGAPIVDTRTLAEAHAADGPHDCSAPDAHGLAESAERFRDLGFYDLTALGAPLVRGENIVAVEYEAVGTGTGAMGTGIDIGLASSAAPVQLTWADNSFSGPAFYYVRVTQVDGHQAWISPIWVDRLSPDTTTPAAPNGLVANQDGADVYLDWPKVTKDSQGNIESMGFYRIFRGTRADFSPDRVGFTNQIGTTTKSDYRDTGATSGASDYYYRIVAVDAAGNESSSHSNLAFMVHKQWTYAPTRSNIHWIAVPWISLSNSASELARELNHGSSGPVRKLVRWDVATQRPVSWMHYKGQWVGTNFSIVPGQSVGVTIQSDLSAVLVGAHTSGQSVRLTPNPGTQSLTWVSVPLVSQYVFASSIVNDINRGVSPSIVRRIVRFSANQAYQAYEWNGSGWSGTNFVVQPGEGYAVQVQATADWIPVTIP
jgi:hypothetical protein